jgi:hypothetical protein
VRRQTNWIHFIGVLAACVGLAATPAQALFEDLALSPRARAMGEATIATTNDAWAFYYNPAMLSLVPVAQAELTTVTPNGLGFNRLSSAGVSAPLPGGAGALAFGWRRYAVEFDDVKLTSENTLSVGHGFRIFGDASTSAYMGWTLNFFNAEFSRTIGAAGDGTDGIEPGNAWAVGLDVGGLVKIYERTRLGFFTRNLNSPTIGDDSEELSRQVGVGIAYEPYPGVTSAFDLRSTLGEQFRFCGGIEFNVVPALDLRVGVETEPNKVTGGFGIHLPVLTLDYGFSTGGGVLDASHHFGVALRWEKPGSEAKP